MSKINTSNTPGYTPNVNQLPLGDILINTYDGKVYIKKTTDKERTIIDLTRVTSSFSISSSYAANGGVTQLIAGSNITLSPANGKGIVTINALTGSGGSGTPNGPNYSLQYNNGGNFSGSGNFTLLNNNALYLTGSFNVSGSTNVVGNSIITGSLSLSAGSALNINDSFYVNGNKQFNYGQFSSTQTQSGSANTAYSITFNTTDFSQGVSLISGSRLTISNTGIYNIQFSTQLHTTVNQAVDFSIWFAMTGSNIANSNTDFTIEKVSGGGFAVAALNFLTQIQSGSYIELKYSKTTTNGQLQAKAPIIEPIRPATPSAIITVTQVA
jgi:hypothetical protein